MTVTATEPGYTPADPDPPTTPALLPLSGAWRLVRRDPDGRLLVSGRAALALQIGPNVAVLDGISGRWQTIGEEGWRVEPAEDAAENY